MKVTKLFASYNRTDHHSAYAIKQELIVRGINLHLNAEPVLEAEQVWPSSLLRQLEQVEAMAVFIGPKISLWQKRSLGVALAHQTTLQSAGHYFPLIPVLLPEADIAFAFSFAAAWVDLRHDLADSQALGQLADAAKGLIAKRPVAVIADHCPYPGLKPFREEDAPFFFGRATLLTDLSAALEQSNWVTLLGAADSGKTSLIQAGLLPHLRRQVSGAEWWEMVTVTLDDRPFDRLATALLTQQGPTTAAQIQVLARQLAAETVSSPTTVKDNWSDTSPKARSLLIIDQFEALFTQVSAPERKKFVALLLSTLAHWPDLTILIALQQAWYGAALEFDEPLSTWLSQQVIQIKPLGPEALRAAINQAARPVTIACEPSLLKRLVRDSDNLALSSFTLQALWQTQQGRLLREADYIQMGGVEGIVDYRAERRFKTLSAREQQVLHHTLLQLLEIDENNQVTHRAANLRYLSETVREPKLHLLLQPFLIEGLLTRLLLNIK